MQPILEMDTSGDLPTRYLGPKACNRYDRFTRRMARTNRLNHVHIPTRTVLLKE